MNTSPVLVPRHLVLLGHQHDRAAFRAEHDADRIGHVRRHDRPVLAHYERVARTVLGLGVGAVADHHVVVHVAAGFHLRDRDALAAHAERDFHHVRRERGGPHAVIRQHHGVVVGTHRVRVAVVGGLARGVPPAPHFVLDQRDGVAAHAEGDIHHWLVEFGHPAAFAHGHGVVTLVFRDHRAGHERFAAIHVRHLILGEGQHEFAAFHAEHDRDRTRDVYDHWAVGPERNAVGGAVGCHGGGVRRNGLAVQREAASLHLHDRDAVAAGAERNLMHGRRERCHPHAVLHGQRVVAVRRGVRATAFNGCAVDPVAASLKLRERDAGAAAAERDIHRPRRERRSPRCRRQGSACSCRCPRHACLR